MAWRKFYAQGIVKLLLLAALLSCGGGGGSPAPPPPPSGTPFYAADFNTSKYYTVYSSVVATGTHCYIYVENGLTVSPTEANAIKNEFDNNIYPNITTRFGSEPNPGVDGDPRIYILLSNIRDGFDSHSSPSYVGGYFMSGNEYSMSDNSYSNEKEMFYMNFNPVLKQYVWPTGFYTTLAHEFQHMIHWEQKTNKGYDDDTWLNEAMSEVAPTYLYGPSYDRIYDYEQAPSDSLTIWKDSIDDYGIAYMWSQYFKDQFDPGSTGAIFSGIMQQNATGITSVDYALNTLASGKTFASTFNDMAIAIVSGKTMTWPSHPEWSYTSIDTKKGTYDGVSLPGLVLTIDYNKNQLTLPVLDPWSVGYSWYQLGSGVTGTVTWTRTSPAGATADFINYGNGSPPISLTTGITSGMSYTYNTTGILIVSTPSPTAGGSVVNASLSAGISSVSMTPEQMLSKANTYAVKHKKNQKICVQSFFAEKEKALRAKGMRPKF